MSLFQRKKRGESTVHGDSLFDGYIELIDSPSKFVDYIDIPFHLSSHGNRFIVKLILTPFCGAR